MGNKGLDFPISLEKMAQQKQDLFNVSTQIGDIIEMSPEIGELLGSIYLEESLLAKSVEVLGDNLYKIKFKFPEYTLAKKNVVVDHVSINQMQQAIVQGLFTSIGLSIKQNGVNSPMSYETYLLNRANALYRRDKRTMRKKLKFGEESYLVYRVEPIIKKKTMYSINVKMLRDRDSFLDGEVECIMQDMYLIDEEMAKHQDIDYKNITAINHLEATKENIKDTLSMARSSCVKTVQKNHPKN